MQHKIGLMAMYLAAARQLTYGATRRMEHWQDKKLDAAMSSYWPVMWSCG